MRKTGFLLTALLAGALGGVIAVGTSVYAARNGSGTYTLPSGNPVSSGATISSTWANNTLSDIADEITNSVARDGQSSMSGNLQMGTNRITGLATGTARTDAPTAAQVQDSSLTYLTSVSGTNTITATAAVSMSAYATGQKFHFLPANTNTGATTINANSIGAKNIYFNGAALVGGELKQNVPATIVYDGTQFNLVSPIYTSALTADSSPESNADYVTTYDNSATAHKKVLLGVAASPTLGTEQATTSGTAINFTGIPAWAKRVTVNFVGVSTNGTADLLIQIGPSGGIETSGYASTATSFVSGTATVVNGASDGFIVAANVGSGSAFRGAVTLNLEDSSDNTWTMTGSLAQINALDIASGSKALAGAISKLTITTDGGTNTFDAGAINISWE